MDEESKSLWDRVCATVTKLGQPKPVRVRRFVPCDPMPTTLDLHGYPVEDAYHEVKFFLSVSTAKQVTIITGKSGIICREFPFWMEHLGYRFESTNSGGAFLVRP